MLGLFLYNVLVDITELAVKSRFKSISLRHQKKLLKFRKAQTAKNWDINPRLMKHIVHSFSSYNLSQVEINAISYGLDHHIPTNINSNVITTEFESFFQSLLKDISNMPENKINKVKTKLRSTYEKYCNIKVPHTQRKIIFDLSKRDDNILLKQDKGRGLVVLMDRSKYTEKCLKILSTKQFTVVENDHTKPLESKIQHALRKLKSKITDQEYKHLYLTGSQPGKFYGTAKMHKLPVNGNHNDLPLRPIVCNINTST